MTTTTPPSYQPRVIEHGETPGEGRPRIRLPEQWLRGLLAGAEALILSWLVLVVPAVATYVATAADPALGSAGWVQAAQVGTAGWFLAHGAVLGPGTTGAEGFEISVVPLGVSLLYVVLVATAVRRARLQSWAPVVVAIVTYVALGSLLLSLVTVAAPAGLIGAALVATFGSLWGVRGRNLPLPSWLTAAPQWLLVGWQGAWRVVLLLFAVATLVTVAAIVAGFDQIQQVHAGLHADPVSTVVIVFAQLLVAPLLVVWTLAFLLGPGFAVGTDTIISPNGIEVGPLPVIPVLGALPEPDSLLGDLPFLVAIGVAVGAGAGWWLVRRQRELPLWRSLAAAAVLLAIVTAVVAAAAWLTSGAIGPGAMAQLGPDVAAIAWAACWQLAAGTVVGVVVAHRDTHAALRTAWRLGRAQVRSGSAPTGVSE